MFPVGGILYTFVLMLQFNPDWGGVAGGSGGAVGGASEWGPGWALAGQLGGRD